MHSGFSHQGCSTPLPPLALMGVESNTSTWLWLQVYICTSTYMPLRRHECRCSVGQLRTRTSSLLETALSLAPSFTAYPTITIQMTKHLPNLPPPHEHVCLQSRYPLHIHFPLATTRRLFGSWKCATKCLNTRTILSPPVPQLLMSTVTHTHTNSNIQAQYALTQARAMANTHTHTQQQQQQQQKQQQHQSRTRVH